MSSRAIGVPITENDFGSRSGEAGVAARCRFTAGSSSPNESERPSGAVMRALPTDSDAASTRNCRAAASVSSPRTWAAALSRALPLSAMVWLPAVSPSSGERPVSALRKVISAGAICSSSAATCSSAVRTPVPSSTLPVYTVTWLSGAILIQASR